MALTGQVVTRVRAELSRVAADGGRCAERAEIALGEGPVEQRLAAAICALAEHRGPDSSTCPSDAARAVGGENWRDLMADARDLARDLARTGEVEITQRGKVLDPDSDWHGPIRIRIVSG
ncbi:hypothetical protein BH10ACT9_BH10ACT9_03070 [soil metagenome]